MAKANNKNTKKYTVTLVPHESLKQSPASKICFVEAPQYDPATDEPAFEQAWQTVKEQKAQGKIKPVPVAPIGRIRLRGSRAKLQPLPDKQGETIHKVGTETA